jgi:aryl-alcohol dehydrogenase-like predicted oxidoreductase
MQQRPLGRTGIQVSALGFGGAEIGFENASAETVAKLLGAALDAGLTLIDTAECYATSEELIGAAVAHRRQDYALFTKVGHASGLPFPDWDIRLIGASIERSLERLRTDRVDLVQLHTCSLAQLQEGAIIAELRKARDAGKTRFIGYSGDGEAAKWAAASGVFDTIQTSLSIADQESIEVVLPEARRHGLGVIVKRPIANAAWRYGDQPPGNGYHRPYWERLRALDYPFLKSPRAAEIALRFTLAQEGVSTAIVGTKHPERWQANAALADAGPLPAAEIAAIRRRWSEVARPDWTGQG